MKTSSGGIKGSVPGAGVLRRGTRLPYPLALFPGTDDPLALYYYVDGSNKPHYTIHHHMADDVYCQFWYSGAGPIASMVGSETHRMTGVYMRELWTGCNDQTTPAVTTTGAGWFKGASDSYPGGRIMLTDGAAEYLQVTVSGTRVGGVTNLNGTSVGLALVTIDGSTTLADLLPTAQDLVTAGTFPNTILVANGGTLNPTDRVWDQYANATALPHPGKPSANNGSYTIFSRSLVDTSHTVRITRTGYKRAASSAATLVVYMVLSGSTSMTLNQAARPIFIPLQNTMASDQPIWEISYNTKPTGATNYEWMGHVGSEKLKSAPVLTVDGASLTPTTLTWYYPRSIVLALSLSLRHSEIGAGVTEIGTLDLSYTMTPRQGITIAHTLVWGTTGVCTGYPGMLQVDHAIFTRFNTRGNTAKDLTVADGSTNLNSGGPITYAWDNSGSQAIVAWTPNLRLTVEDWEKADATRKLWWYDVNATWKKSYFTRYFADHAFINGETIQSIINYRAAWIPQGAANVFS